MNLIEVKNLSKQFKRTDALTRVSFEIPQGAVYGFVGPNGSGKTTCLRIMAGLDLPDSGDVLVNGVSLGDYPENARKQIGFMPDAIPSEKTMKVWEYLDFYARAFGLNGAVRDERIEQAARLTNLERLPDKALGALSKGMKQQVSLARVLIHDPEILLLDEPAAGLDPRARIELRNCLRVLALRKKTIFISSHILTELEDFIDGAVIIEKGRLLNYGSLASLNEQQNSILRDRMLRIMLSFRDTAEPFLARLKESALFHSAELHNAKQLLVTLDGGETEFRQAMIQLFQDETLPLIGVSRPDLGLEGLFMNTTKGEVQ